MGLKVRKNSRNSGDFLCLKWKNF